RTVRRRESTTPASASTATVKTTAIIVATAPAPIHFAQAERNEMFSGNRRFGAVVSVTVRNQSTSSAAFPVPDVEEDREWRADDHCPGAGHARRRADSGGEPWHEHDRVGLDERRRADERARRKSRAAQGGDERGHEHGRSEEH